MNMKSILGRGSEEKKAKEKQDKALFTAAQGGDLEAVRLLIDQGADVNHAHKGETPLIAATVYKHSEIVRLLLQRGADYTAKNKKGKTATDIAKENNDVKTKYILSSVLGDVRVFNLLETMGLLEHWEKFLKEEIKYEDLEGYTEKDLEELGIPKGPRGRLLHHFSGGQSQSPGLSQSDYGPKAGSVVVLPRPGLNNLGKGSSHSMTELPIPGRSATFTTRTPPQPDVPDRRSLPLGRPTEPPPVATDHYGHMPRLNGNSPILSPKPGPQQQQFHVEDHYVEAPAFVPEAAPPATDKGTTSMGLGQYAAVGDKSPDYSDFDGSDYADNGEEPVGEYAAPPDLKDADSPSQPKQDNDFDSSSYREINYNELILEEEIGRGAFGSVFRGTWRGAPVAIKKLHSFSISDPHMVAEFRREASMMQLVGNHPNIVKFVGACSKEEPYCLVSLFCSNGSLESFLKKEKLAPVLEAKILMEIAAGVLHLHCEGVIHRDLAARNVLVGDNYQVYITDFGFARIKEAGNSFNTTKSTIGPVKYMAPESLKDKKYSEKTDAFSFGVLLWEILNPGKVPYEGEDLLKIAMEVITKRKRLPLPEDASPVYKKLMQDCWEEDPERRPNFQEIYKRLYENYKELSAGQKGAPGNSPAMSHLPPPHMVGGTSGGPPKPKPKPGPGGPGARVLPPGPGGRGKPLPPNRTAKPQPEGSPAASPKPAPEQQPPAQPPVQSPQPQPVQPPQPQPPQPTGYDAGKPQPPQDIYSLQFPAPASLLPNNYASYNPTTPTAPSPTYGTYTHTQPPSYTPTAPTGYPAYSTQPPAYTPSATTGYASYQPTAPTGYDYNAHYATGGYASYQPTYPTAPPAYPPTGYASYDHQPPAYNPAYPSYPPAGGGYATLPSNYPN